MVQDDLGVVMLEGVNPAIPLDVRLDGFEAAWNRMRESMLSFGRALTEAEIRKRAEHQRAKALKRNAKRANKSPFSARLKDEALSRVRERSSHTAKALNSIGQAKLVGWTPRPQLAYDASKRRKSPPRGRALDIPYLGHLYVKQNPALKDWADK